MRIEHWLEINECFYAMNRLTIFMHISMVGILELNFLYSLPFVEHGAGCLDQEGNVQSASVRCKNN